MSGFLPAARNLTRLKIPYPQGCVGSIPSVGTWDLIPGSSMNSLEVFYLHIQGEQRGPYTIKHIDHLLNSGLISEETLFWREGLEQWQPVTQLVALRRPKPAWKLPLAGLIAILVLGFLVYLFGPITLDGWREIYQHDFSAHAAYWRARDVVRTQCVPDNALVHFDTITTADIQLDGSAGATLFLHGILNEGKNDARPVTWKVRLLYDPVSREWSGVEAGEVGDGVTG